MASAGNAKPTISVVLPVRNEGRFIGSVLQELAEQDFPRGDYEVIVVDGESTDDTVTIASKYRDRFERFQIIENPKRLSAAARNLGFRAATGEFILYVDGHCRIPSKRLLADMAAIFRKNDVDVLCRPQPQTAGPQTYLQQAVSLARSSSLGHALDSTIYNDQERVVPAASSGAMYRRDVFDKIGEFDEQFDACEDVEFNTSVDKAGLKAMISPKLTVEYAARTSLRGLFRQLYRYGYGRWLLFRKHPSTLGIGTLIPVLFVLGLFALPFTWLVSFKAGLIVSVPYVFYLIAASAVSLGIARKNRKSLIFILPFIFFTIHFAFGIGFIVALTRSQR
jgi:succinoglycan biosynthesis protein ExoA